MSYTACNSTGINQLLAKNLFKSQEYTRFEDIDKKYLVVLKPRNFWNEQ